jgi:xylulose-5-phosphate/fructose-6-phosphate phosphoketolase
MNLTQSNNSDVAVSAYGTARSTVQGAPLSSEELREIDEYWRASLYLCLGMEALFVGYGYTPYFVEGSEADSMHQAKATALEHCVLEIRKIQNEARRTGKASRPRWPMVILRSPKGWTAPRKVDGHYLEGFWRAHQIPLPDVHSNSAHLQLLEKWLRSYEPVHFDEAGRLIPGLRALPPKGTRRMSANPVANGGLLRKPLNMPDFRTLGVDVKKPGTIQVGNCGFLGALMREIMRAFADSERSLACRGMI